MVKKGDKRSAGAAAREEAPPDGRILPLLLLSDSGAVVDVAWMNTKGFNKSREQGVLWAVHDETGRLLPYAGNTPFLRLLSFGRWYQAVVSAEVAVDLASAESAIEEPDAAELSGKGGAAPAPGDAGGQSRGRGPEERPQPDAASGPRGAAAATASATGAEGEGARGAVDTLTALRDVIERRKRELPEGSYTSYLFKAGADKIRKKTGEEAVELLLARERTDVVAESADLIYHLLVLLAELGIGLDEVLAELEKRSK